jgi:hypothetical protein
MEKHESSVRATDGLLPRPVVLSPEDLERVAAAAAAMVSVLPSLKNLTIAGGIPIGPIATPMSF